MEPLSLDDVPTAPGGSAAAPAKRDDAIGRLFERTPAPSELTPIAAKAVIAADKAKAEAAERAKLAMPELVMPEMFSVEAGPAPASANRSRRNVYIAAALGVAVVGGAAVLLMGHSSKPAAPAVAKATPPSGHAAEHSSDPGSNPNAQPSDHTAPPDQQPGSAAEPPTIDLPDDHVAPSAKPGPTSHAGSAAPGATLKPGASATPGTAATPGATTGSGATTAAKPAATGAGSAAAKPGATVEAPVSADGCDKVSCVIDAYARPCCEPFRPRKPGEAPSGLDRDMIIAGMSKAKAAVIHCGEATPSAKGIVRLAMKVAADGSVTEAAVAETPDPALGECVAAAVRKVTFAQTDQGGTFNYPFKF